MKLLVTTAGFETRCLAFANSCINKRKFDCIVLIDYSPTKFGSRYKDLYMILRNIIDSENKIVKLIYERYDPHTFEENYLSEDCIFLNEPIHNYDEIYIDISVMSKLLILQWLYFLREYKNCLKIIYTEPQTWAPSEEKFIDLQKKGYKNTALDIFPTYGVSNVLTTPMLSSIMMYRAPVTLITFLSFNEQLIRALINEVNFSELILINKSTSSNEDWREKALVQLNKSLIDQYKDSNQIHDDKLDRVTDSLDYLSTFNLLSNLYLKRCYSNRIILSPTGSKLQAVACALIKICCPDIHIEYPVPESYFVEGYSSSTVKTIHEITFEYFKADINKLINKHHLNI